MNSPKDTPDGVISHQRADEILLGRSTDSRRGDMEALRKYVEFLRGELSVANDLLDAHISALSKMALASVDTDEDLASMKSLLRRCLDVVRLSMAEHGGMLSHTDRTARAVLLQDLIDSLFPNAATVVGGPTDSCQTCSHAPGCPNEVAGGFCMYHHPMTITT